MNSDNVREKVRRGYGEIAAGAGACGGSAKSCCGSSATASEELAKHIGYSEEELAALPESANMGLSCGNPNALAALQPGEVVLDLGSGGGFDVFIAGRKVGPAGRAMGVDMTPEMLAKARRNIAAYRERSALDNVEFRLGEIEHLPLADASVDVVISNCVINLSPDKPQVWREISRVLKPGGRVAVSDLALIQPLPAVIAGMVEAMVGCVAGAVLVSETERMAREAGLVNIELKAKSDYIDGMVDWQDPLYHKITAHLPAGAKPSDYITSLDIQARKPAKSNMNSGISAKRIPLKLAEGDPATCCVSSPASLWTPAVAELAAMGAAIAANCEPCLKYHYHEAQRLGISKADMAHAVRMAVTVKDAPHQSILRLADRLTGTALSHPAPAPDKCCGTAGQGGSAPGNSCCG